MCEQEIHFGISQSLGISLCKDQVETSLSLAPPSKVTPEHLYKLWKLGLLKFPTN